MLADVRAELSSSSYSSQETASPDTQNNHTYN